MSEKILVPALGESITEATVAKWLKNVGDTVEIDEPIVELETDKVNLEVPSPIVGILTEIIAKDGSVVEVGAHLGSIEEKGIKESAKKEKINKIELNPKENNIIKLDASKKEPKIFEEKSNEKKPLILKDEEEKPLVLKDEIVEQNLSNHQKNNKTLSPAVRKIVIENKIE